MIITIHEVLCRNNLISMTNILLSSGSCAKGKEICTVSELKLC